MDHPRPGLRYVDADDLDDSSFDFDGLNVETADGEKLGDVDGFVIDVASARPYYVVVDAGGWFSSKYFLLPVGHASLDSTESKLIADVTRDRVRNFPGFDRDEFAKLTDADLDRMDRQIVTACSPNDAIGADRPARYADSTHYRNPSWWDASYYRPDRADSNARAMGATGTTAALGARGSVGADPLPAAHVPHREQVVARTDDAAVGDVSPHLGGRAQPGDVLGVETGGEQTHVGETSDDENKRRRDAEKSVERHRK
jgi:hypothetical protein